MKRKRKRREGARGALFLASTATVLALALLHRRSSPTQSSTSPDAASPATDPERAAASPHPLASFGRRIALASTFATLVLVAAASVPALAALPLGRDLVPARPAFSGIAASGVRPRPLAQIELLRLASALAALEAATPAPAAAEEPAPPPPVAGPPAAPSAPPRQAVAAAPSPAAAQAPGGVIQGVRVTFYACLGNGFCGLMANGQQAFEGAAACSSDLPTGTRFSIVTDPTGRTYECLDRGRLAPTWVDVWWYDAADGWAWQSQVGSWSDIIVQP